MISVLFSLSLKKFCDIHEATQKIVKGGRVTLPEGDIKLSVVSIAMMGVAVMLN